MGRYPGRFDAHEERNGGKFQGRRDVTRPGIVLEGYIIISTNRGPFYFVPSSAGGFESGRRVTRDQLPSIDLIPSIDPPKSVPAYQS